MNQEALFIPRDTTGAKTISLSKSISAVQLVPKEHEGAGIKLGLGLLSQLGPGVILEICGDGFDDRTVMVRSNGECYVVFSQDIEGERTAAAD
jgi:hypothetical protein